jgi:hypothetical protein
MPPSWPRVRAADLMKKTLYVLLSLRDRFETLRALCDATGLARHRIDEWFRACDGSEAAIVLCSGTNWHGYPRRNMIQGIRPEPDGSYTLCWVNLDWVTESVGEANMMLLNTLRFYRTLDDFAVGRVEVDQATALQSWLAGMAP